MKASKLLLTGLILFVTNQPLIFAQISQIEVSAKYNPISKYLPPADSASKPGKATQAEINLSALVNIHTKVDTATGKIRSLGSNIHARYTGFNREGYHQQILPPDLYALNVGLFYYATINKKWAYSVFLNTAVNSDFQQVDKNDLFLTGGGIFIRQFTPDFSLGLGAIVHNNLGGFMPWPALTVDWKMGGKVKLEIRTPDKSAGIAHYVGVSYALQERWNVSFAFQPEVLSYDVMPGHERNNRLMSFWQLPFTFSSAFRIGNFEIIPSVGFTALRRYAYGEKKVSEMFTEYPYHGLGTNLTYGIGLKYKPFRH